MTKFTIVSLVKTASAALRHTRKNTERVTLGDLAKLIGMTKVTVSRASNTPELVLDGTLECIREVVQQTGYTPDLIAGSLVSSHNRSIITPIPTIAGSVFQETVTVLTARLVAAGYRLSINQSDYDESREDTLFDVIVGRRPVGIVLTGVVHSASVRQKLQAADVLIVETWDITRNPLGTLVGFSHQKASQVATHYLKRRGAERPAAITSGDRRAQACTQAFAKTSGSEARIPVTAAESPVSLGDGQHALGTLLEQYPNADAIFCDADTLTLGVLMEAKHRGIAVPAQLHVVGYGNQVFAKGTTPTLTAIHIGGTSIGKLATTLPVNRTEHGDEEQRTVDAGFTLVECDSA